MPRDAPAVLLVAPVLPELERRLEAEFTLLRALPGPGRKAALRTAAPHVAAVVTSGSHGLTADEVAVLERLGLVTIFGVGLDALPLDLLTRRGVAVGVTPVLTDDVADLAVALWLAASRRVASADRFVRSGEWAASGQHPLTRRASGRPMGVFGFGRIGQAIAARIRPFASEVIYASRRVADGSPHRAVGGLLELAHASEVLFLAAPGGAQTHGIVDAEVLDALGPQGVLVNVARGSLVDEAALARALAEGRLGAAALDVFVHEPAVPAELIALPNIVLSPHGGSATLECRREMADCVLANLHAYFEGRPLPAPAL